MGAIKNKAIEIAIKQGLEKVTKDRDNNWNQYIRNIMEDIDDDNIEKILMQFHCKFSY